jgi:polysaccharide biosynthesis/export protein
MTKYQNQRGFISCVFLLLLPLTTFAENPPAAAPATAALEVHDDYVIGLGDTLQVNVFRNPELTVALPVRPDGEES